MEQTVQDHNRELLSFIDSCPSPYHVAQELRQRLVEEGFNELKETDGLSFNEPGKYFVVRGSSAVIAFEVPCKKYYGYLLMAAHGDAPTFRIKEIPEETVAGEYTRVCVEGYGSMLCYPWLDRPLSAAGRLLIQTENGFEERLVKVDRDLMVIPSVAIHFDRQVNNGKKFEKHIDMQPLYAQRQTENGIVKVAAEAAGVHRDMVAGYDLLLYPRTPGSIWGADHEFISSPRLDDLQCVFGCLEGFLKAENKDHVKLLCVFNHEEVGSRSMQGADSDFLEAVLEGICSSMKGDLQMHRALLNRSFMVSADNAHAIHPNHPEVSDRTNHPVLNGGVVIKFNADQKYTTDGVSAALFRKLCERCEVPVQVYANRADMPGGSTLGNISLAHVSVPCVDIGLAQLAMHSCYETAGARDTAYLIRAAQKFYEADYRCSEGCLSI